MSKYVLLCSFRITNVKKLSLLYVSTNKNPYLNTINKQCVTLAHIIDSTKLKKGVNNLDHLPLIAVQKNQDPMKLRTKNCKESRFLGKLWIKSCNNHEFRLCNNRDFNVYFVIVFYPILDRQEIKATFVTKCSRSLYEASPLYPYIPRKATLSVS